MKNYIILSAFAFVTVISCKNPQEDEAVIRQRDSLMAVINERENSVNEFMTSFNSIERDLALVASKQHIILKSSNKGDIKTAQKERINEEIKIINELMEVNNRKIKELTAKVNSTSDKNIQLQKTVQLLNDQLTQKYQELQLLNERLNELNV